MRGIDSYVVTTLPPAVEQFLQLICSERSLPLPDDRAKAELASLGEESAFRILAQIRSVREIRNLSGFIIYLAKQVQLVSPTPTPTTPALSQESVCFSPSSSPRTPPPPSAPPERVFTSLPSSSTSTAANGERFSPQLVALGELEFRKAFLILVYIGNNKLEDLVAADMILGWKDLPMCRFEQQVWAALGRRCVPLQDRNMCADWDSGRTHYYYCNVYPDGGYKFKGPHLNKQTTHLHRVLGDENVLIVKFAEELEDQNNLEIDSHNLKTTYKRIIKRGILVGLRRYQFFVFKDGGKEEKKKNPTSSPVKCFFVRMESNAAADKNNCYILSNKTVHEARCVFMHVHMVSSLAKYMARLSLILSKTIRLNVDLTDVNVVRIDDYYCRDDNDYFVYNKDGERLIHTDGTGFISEDLASMCPLNVHRGSCFDSENNKRSADLVDMFSELMQSEPRMNDPPLVMQIRMFYKGCAVKGTLLVNRKLPPKTIHIRPSMIKVESDPKLSSIETVNSLELVGTSRKTRKTYFSKYLIALLSYGGVPKEFFISILTNALEESQSIFSNKRAAMRMSLQYGDMDGNILAGMILAGIPLNEPSLQFQLSKLSDYTRKDLKEGRLPASESFYLIGTVDPTGTLRSDEVCIILENGQISGKVLVFRNPGIHFGDIHVLNATYVKAIEDIVGNAKYGIFFPTKGPRSVADEMAGGDFDGDLYWVSRNPELLKYFRAGKPWIPSFSPKTTFHKKPSEFSAEELEDQLVQLFLTARFQPSSAAGTAAESWLTYMDRLLTESLKDLDERDCLKKKMLQLVDLYYDALDAPKAGTKIEVPDELKAKCSPHFLGRENNCYKSTSILGKIYDAVECYEKEMQQSKDIVEISTLSCFDGEVPGNYLDMWQRNYDQYRLEMSLACQQDKPTTKQLADDIFKKYKQLLYGCEEFEDSTKSLEQIFQEALAIYQVTYKYARRERSVEKCHFAWKVAGSALCKLYAKNQGERTMTCSPSVLKELFQ